MPIRRRPALTLYRNQIASYRVGGSGVRVMWHGEIQMGMLLDQDPDMFRRKASVMRLGPSGPEREASAQMRKN